MLRAGGHLKEYTPPSARAMYTGRDLPYQMENGGNMALGGDLKVLDGGYAETISYNPFMPGTGETVMFRGRSHDNGGIPVEYGQNGVEVEGGEPMYQMQDGGQMGNPSETNTSGVVAGNMVVDKFAAEQIGDLKAKDRKYKHVVADYAKVESKQNKIVEKNTKLINDADTSDQFDKLTFNSGQASLIGANMKLKDIANKKMNLAAVQNAILDTAKEHGLESDALAKGKIKYAKANDPYAEFGAKLEEFGKGGKKSKKSTVITAPSKDINSLQGFVKNIPFAERKKMAANMGISNYTGTADQNAFLLNKTQISDIRPIDQPSLKDLNTVNQVTPDVIKTVMNKSIKDNGFGHRPDSITGNQNPWETAATFANSMIPHLRPSNQIDLEAAQLAPEINALSDNTLEPVYAQTYQPQYTQPISISYQDQLNANQSDFNAMQRQFGYSPEIAAALAGQKYGANAKVLGEQFRMNQAEQQRARETNRETANDAQLKNMAIYQDQATKMAQTKSTLKQQKQVALSSIADKIAKNKLENRQLGIAENLYNYRYSPNGVAYNMNPLANWNTSGGTSTGKGKINGLPSDWMSLYDETGEFQGTKKRKESDTDTKVRNGSIVKAIKNL
jgi:hypothetical protein